jgi:hypothetical protein
VIGGRGECDYLRGLQLPRCYLASLFRAIWVEGRHMSSAYEVRRVITGII